MMGKASLTATFTVLETLGGSEVLRLWLKV